MKTVTQWLDAVVSPLVKNLELSFKPRASEQAKKDELLRLNPRSSGETPREREPTGIPARQQRASGPTGGNTATGGDAGAAGRAAQQRQTSGETAEASAEEPQATALGQRDEREQRRLARQHRFD